MRAPFGASRTLADESRQQTGWQVERQSLLGVVPFERPVERAENGEPGRGAIDPRRERTGGGRVIEQPAPDLLIVPSLAHERAVQSFRHIGKAMDMRGCVV